MAAAKDLQFQRHQDEAPHLAFTAALEGLPIHTQAACLPACLHCAAVTGTFDVELAQLVFAPWPANPAQYSHGKSPNQHSYMQLQVGVISAIQP